MHHFQEWTSYEIWLKIPELDPPTLSMMLHYPHLHSISMPV